MTETNNILQKARNGRKFRMGLISILTLVATLAVASISPAIAAIYGTFVGGLTLVYAIYCGGNIGAAHVAKKTNNNQPGPAA